jgi:hypothetical protein
MLSLLIPSYMSVIGMSAQASPSLPARFGVYTDGLYGIWELTRSKSVSSLVLSIGK